MIVDELGFGVFLGCDCGYVDGLIDEFLIGELAGKLLGVDGRAHTELDVDAVGGEQVAYVFERVLAVDGIGDAMQQVAVEAEVEFLEVCGIERADIFD